MKIRIGFFIAFVFACPAQATVFTATISQDSISVGDRILFEAIALVPKGASVIPPDAGVSFGKFVVKEWTSDKVEKKTADSLNFKYVLSQYEIEQCTIPSVRYIVTLAGKSDTLLSKPMPVRFVFIRSDDSAAPSIRDLKPQQIAGSPSLAWLWLVLGAMALTAMVFFSRRFLKKRTDAVRAAVPLKPPYEEALEALRLLEEKQYLMKGMIREQVFELSDILKRYIERRFGINAAEYTTEEMLGWIFTSSLEPAEKKSAEWFFSATDPVKFAKMLPDNDTLHRFGHEVRQFLEHTRPILETAPVPKDKEHAT